MTDDQLLRILKTGQQDALEQMMNKYHRYVYSIIAAIVGTTGGPEDIEELLQDTFYSVWTHADSIYVGKLKSYLSTTARNKAKSWLRGRKDLPMALDTIEIPDPRSSLEDAAVQKELGQLLRRAIQKMRPKDREIFMRHYFFMQTAKEISLQMDLPLNTVLSRLTRGRKILKKILLKGESL